MGSYLRVTCECGHENIRSLESYAAHPYCLQEVKVRDGRAVRQSLCRSELDEIAGVTPTEAKQRRLP